MNFLPSFDLDLFDLDLDLGGDIERCNLYGGLPFERERDFFGLTFVPSFFNGLRLL